LNRRRFLTSAVGAGALTLGAPWVATAGAATEDDLAYANFGAATEFLVQDFYSNALKAKLFARTEANALKHGRSCAAQHAKALSDLLVGAGDVAPLEEDFEFEWPAKTFKSKNDAIATGVGVLRVLLGAYQTAAATVTEPSHRVLYASLTASIGQQIAALAAFEGTKAVEPFPVATDLETASDALESYLG
jgi:Ferritin-like domain